MEEIGEGTREEGGRGRKIMQPLLEQSDQLTR